MTWINRRPSSIRSRHTAPGIALLTTSTGLFAALSIEIHTKICEAGWICHRGTIYLSTYRCHANGFSEIILKFLEKAFIEYIQHLQFFNIILTHDFPSMKDQRATSLQIRTGKCLPIMSYLL